MRLLFDEYSDVIFEVIVSSFIYVFVVYYFLTSLINTNSAYIKEVISPINVNVENTPVRIESFTVIDALINIDETFNYLDYVEAYNSKGEDIKNYVTLLDLPDLNKQGEYELTYILRYNGQSKAYKANLIIVNNKKEMEIDEVDV